MAERYFNTNEIALEELKAKELHENTNKSTKFWLKVWQDRPGGGSSNFGKMSKHHSYY
jgi:hypothetical protein